jgi:hypothetical protein
MGLDDLNALLKATQGGEAGIEQQGWADILRDVECDEAGLDSRALHRLYDLPGAHTLTLTLSLSHTHIYKAHTPLRNPLCS